MRLKRLLPGLVFTLFLLLACGCARNIYVAPNAVVTAQPDKAAPITVGLVIPQAVRDAWYPQTTTRQVLRKRVDVPVGNLALDFARTGMGPAFEDFYIERYRDRRSEKGFLATLTQINYELKDKKVVLSTSVTIENEQQDNVFNKDYVMTSEAPTSGLTIPFISKSDGVILEESTEAVYNSFYKQLVDDIYLLTGFVKAPVDVKPQETGDPSADAAPAEAPPTDTAPQE